MDLFNKRGFSQVRPQFGNTVCNGYSRKGIECRSRPPLNTGNEEKGSPKKTGALEPQLDKR